MSAAFRRDTVLMLSALPDDTVHQFTAVQCLTDVICPPQGDDGDAAYGGHRRLN